LFEQTPLANFEKNIKELMDKTGYDYSLEFIDVVATYECFEPYYILCWYDNGIHIEKFHFETLC
jgi:hypothetical protein